MITYNHVEDYLEVLAGYREITSSPKKTNLAWVFPTKVSTPPISLARYDVNIVNSMAEAVFRGQGLTDRQSDLVIRLIEKYQKQFASHGVDVTEQVRNPQYRIPVRIIDRTRSVTIKDQAIILKFPYDKTLVPAVSAAAAESKGHFKFDRDLKEWHLAITEYNVNWAYSLKEYGFAIDPAVESLMQLILDCEKNDYKIELQVVDGQPTIVNAEASMVNYIREHLGGMTADNLVRLIDSGPVLGYTISQDIQNALDGEFDSITWGLMNNKSSHVVRNDPQSGGQELLEPLIKYAKMVNRWPICVYEPDTSDNLKRTLQQLFGPKEILCMPTGKNIDTEVDLTGIKCVYFSKIRRTWSRTIPILVSTNAMIFGGDKLNMFQSAEKVVYYTATTLNKEAKTIAGQVNN